MEKGESVPSRVQKERDDVNIQLIQNVNEFIFVLFCFVFFLRMGIFISVYKKKKTY